MTSRDIPKGVIVVNCFSRVASAKFEIFFRSKKHSIPRRNAHLKLLMKNVGILSVLARYRHFRDLTSLRSTTLNILNQIYFYNFEYIELNLLAQHLVVIYKFCLKFSQ